jgi:hypothetical protein
MARLYFWGLGEITGAWQKYRLRAVIGDWAAKSKLFARKSARHFTEIHASGALGRLFLIEPLQSRNLSNK